MSYTIHRVEQGSPEWLALRAGRVGASDAGDVDGVAKAGASTAGRAALLVRMATERLTGLPTPNGFTNADMQRGHDLEPICRGLLEADGEMIAQVGYLADNDRLIGLSPDGVTPDGGLVELKAPRAHNVWGYWKSARGKSQLGAVPAGYRNQVLHALLVKADAPRLLFAAYSPDLPAGLQLFRCTVERDAVAASLEAYRVSLVAFLAAVDDEDALMQEMIHGGTENLRTVHR